MTVTRRLAAIPFIGAALVLVAFGVVRGAIPAGPGHGVRLRVEIAPPLDETVRADAERMARMRLEESGGPELRIVRASEGMVIEFGQDDPLIVPELVAVLQRQGMLELHRLDDGPWLARVASHAANDPAAREAGIRVDAGTLVANDRTIELDRAAAVATGCTNLTDGEDKLQCTRKGGDVLAHYLADLFVRQPQLAPPPERLVAYGHPGNGDTWRAYALARDIALDGRLLTSVKAGLDGVDITARDRAAVAKLVRVPIAFVLGGKVSFVGTPDSATVLRDGIPHLHVPTPGPTKDAAFDAADHLQAVVLTGAENRMRVVHQETFTRATGFFPRAWPFLAAGLALLVIAVALAWRRR